MLALIAVGAVAVLIVLAAVVIVVLGQRPRNGG
jgi:hypothetical protein